MEEMGDWNLYEAVLNAPCCYVDAIGGSSISLTATKFLFKQAISLWKASQKGTEEDKAKAANGMHAALLAATGYFADSLPTTADFFQYWLTNPSGKPKWLTPPSLLYEDAKVKPKMTSEIEARMKKFYANGGGLLEVQASGHLNVEPAKQDIRLVVGHVELYYKMRWYPTKLGCNALTTWWIDDTYVFTKSIFQLEDLEIPEDILKDQVTRNLAKTFQTRAQWYGEHTADFSSSPSKFTHQYKSTKYPLSLEHIFED